jgi:glycosyl transferase, family 25
MKIYLINLDRHPDRLAHMSEQLSGIAFERVAAIDGKNIPRPPKGLSHYELACLESHKIAWRSLLSGQDRHACVLEDDLHIWPDFAALVRNEVWIPEDAHVVKLDTYFQKVKLGDKRAAFCGREVARLYTRHQSSAAYLVTRKGALRYLELTARPKLPADYALFPKNPRRLGLHVYQLTPAIAVQDHLRRSEDGGRAFATAMATIERSAPQTRSGLSLNKLARESTRLAGQLVDLREAVYQRAFLRVETTTVGVR